MLYHNNQHRRRNIIYIRRNDMVSNKKQKSKPVTLQEAIDGFLMACHARMLSTHTIDDYTRTLKKFVTHTGDMPFEDIRTTQITAFLAAQKVGVGVVLIQGFILCLLRWDAENSLCWLHRLLFYSQMNKSPISHLSALHIFSSVSRPIRLYFPFTIA